MFRHTLLLALFAASASAQTLPSTSTAADSALTVAPAPAGRTAADTVRALHRLFAKRRKVGNVLTIGAVAADLTAAGVSAAAEERSQRTASTGSSGYGWGPGPFTIGFGGYAVIYGVIAAPVMGVGIQQLIAYGPKREAKIVAQYEANRQLPAKIRRQLRPYLR
ncbi:hypothetical protein MUN81_19260 [Hymenobacter sp. 5317J-9]|uniref:hypothetical protein n=1 Tax=Hymenobacter sp. 5317J-9 TaxID=2932250 RepID=UPI001FD6E378|nr:hypothetical protein [Hymenobacter sp. 5317J-9]UOQ97362.1 hypothetical protein MUN81_19260 [Hymenobacter sp. 5317J-9]